MQNFPLITNVAKTMKPILLKRHFGCSIRDLLGAAEYALVEKNEKVIFCERGVSVPHTHKSTSRFLLDLQAIPAKESSCLPIISDPSHASFWHKWVKPLSLASLAVGAEGLMIETHPDPRNAAVDPLQAINFDEFSSLIDELREVGKVLNKKNCIMTKDLVSIIVRTKNEGFWIGKCLKAIESQSYKNYEVIVVDDKSSDNTIKILKKHFPKVKLVKYKDKKFFSR